MDVTSWFKTRRRNLGLTAREVAIAVGVTERLVYTWESEASAPDPRLTERLRAAYQVSFNEMAVQIATLAVTLKPKSATRRRVA